MSFKHQVVRGRAYMSLRLAAGAVIGLIGITLLTRFIGPANYGIFTAAHATLVYFITMTECGIGVYLIRLERDSPEDFHQALTLLIVFSLVGIALGIPVAFLLERFYNLPEMRTAAIAMVLGLPIVHAVKVPMARLERALDYKRVAVIELVGNKPLLAKVCVIAVDSFRRHLGKLSAALPPGEMEAAARYRRREDSERFIIGRALIRHLCAIHSGGNPRAIEILRTDSGKPYVQSKPGIEFNVSHSGNCVLIAWSVTGPVGVDVEAATPGDRASFLEMAKRIFCPDELTRLRSANADEVVSIFYRIWVRKEALLKASGIGTAGFRRSFAVLNKTPSGVHWFDQVRISNEGPIWKIHDLKVMVGHAASIAVPMETKILEYRDVTGLPAFRRVARPRDDIRQADDLTAPCTREPAIGFEPMTC